MAWVYLDDQFPDHPKVAAAGGDAGWLFVCGLAYVRRFTTEGVIPKAQVPRLSDRKTPTKLARRLVDAGLWIDDGDAYRVHDYHEWNKPQESRSAAARKAAEARWGHKKGDAKRNANASESHSDSTAHADASTCPPPLPPTGENQSSDHSHKATAPPDDEESSKPSPQVGAVIAVLARRDLDRRQALTDRDGVGDAVSWENAAYDRRMTAHRAQAEALLAAHPDLIADQVADLLDPPVEATPASSTDRRDTRHDAQQTAERARAERHMRTARGEGCQACGDTGLTLDEDSNAIPCNHGPA